MELGKGFLHNSAFPCFLEFEHLNIEKQLFLLLTIIYFSPNSKCFSRINTLHVSATIINNNMNTNK